jgi:hypothetical protein
VRASFRLVVIFFFASAGASSAHLTVSETWPIEIRAEAIAVLLGIAQIFGALPDRWTDHGTNGIIELVFRIEAEGKTLETVTKPLTAAAT